MRRATALGEHPAAITVATRRRRKIGASRSRFGLVMAAPVVLLIAIFTFYPFWHAFHQSLYVSSPIFAPRFVGLGNYRDVLTSSYFLDATRTTLLFTVITVPIAVALAVLVALLLNERFIGNTVLRVGMLLPWAVPATIAGVIWEWVFLDSSGALNAFLYSIGFIKNYIQWLTSPNLAMMAVIIVFIWSELPLAAIFLLAAIQAIPDDLYEAAALDGAGSFGRFRSVTLPGIRSMLVVVALYELLIALTNFDITYSLTHGGPGTATTMVTYFTWSVSFTMTEFGQGSALAIIIAAGSLIAILALVRAMPRDALIEEG